MTLRSRKGSELAPCLSLSFYLSVEVQLFRVGLRLLSGSKPRKVYGLGSASHEFVSVASQLALTLPNQCIKV